MSGDLFGCHSRGGDATGIQRGEAADACGQPTPRGAAPLTGCHPAPKISSAEAEKL